jgi:hypothetical protein
MTALELEQAVKKITPQELRIFSDWFEQYTSDKWDEKIEKDILSGRLAKLAAKADADFEARAMRGNREKFERVLAKVPDVEPEHDWDRIPQK